MTRVAFLGTPEAALPALDLLASRHHIGVVVTGPDRPRGRSRRPAPSPVKVRAVELGLHVTTPEDRVSLRSALEEAGPLDVGVVVGYGRILSPEVLAIPGQGMVNIHFSLLPRWRGAAPVTWALLSGDEMTGVTIIRLDEGIDTGPVLVAQATDIGPEETAGELGARLARLGAALIASTLPAYLAGEITPQPQSDQGASYARKLGPGDRPLDPGRSGEEAVRRVRALSPEPGATLLIDGERHQVLRARLFPASPRPGTWTISDGVPVAGFADGGVELEELLPPGRTVMSGAAWARGRRSKGGLVAGEGSPGP